MAVRDDFTAGEVLAAADLNDTFASKPPFAYGTATPSTTVEGFIWYDENDTPPAPKFWDGSAFETFGGGKVLQVVRATDATTRSTTSASYVDANISVTITPQKSTSAIIVIWSAYTAHLTTAGFNVHAITDSSNVALSGAENMYEGSSSTANFNSGLTVIGYATPGVTTAVTYKGRFLAASAGTAILDNASNTAQLYAIEVSA
jgi:hypothetical protein